MKQGLYYPTFFLIGFLALGLSLAKPLPSAAAGTRAAESENEALHVSGTIQNELEQIGVATHLDENEQGDEIAAEPAAKENVATMDQMTTQTSTAQPQTNHFVLRGTVTALASSSMTVDGHAVKLDPTVTGSVHENGTVQIGSIVMVTGTIVNGQLYAQTVHALPAQAQGKPDSLFVAPSLGSKTQTHGANQTVTATAAISTKTTVPATAAHETKQATAATSSFLSHLFSDLATFFHQLFA